MGIPALTAWARKEVSRQAGKFGLFVFVCPARERARQAPVCGGPDTQAPPRTLDRAEVGARALGVDSANFRLLQIFRWMEPLRRKGLQTWFGVRGETGAIKG